MRLAAITLLTTLAGVFVPDLCVAGPVNGSIRTLTRPGTPASSAIVYAEPIDRAAAQKAATVTLTQKDKTFFPRILAIPVGSTVDFPNEDTIFHNVFSLSGPQPFDLGLYRSGATRARTFAQAGDYRVFCNIHPQMTALILVVATPYVATPGPTGRYVLDLPPGRYKITARSDHASPVSVEVVATAGTTDAAALTLDETTWVDTPHKNKFGQDYPAAAYKR
jgi:plastocyanin